MRLSTRTRYGVRAMVQLAEHYGQGPLQIKSIAENQDISVKYLEQLITMLKSGGFVRSIRGAKGGYMLVKPPEEIKVSGIFAALEGPLVTIECVDDEEACERAQDCATREVWAKMHTAIMRVLDSISLADIVKRSLELHKKGKKYPEYQI